MDVASVAERGVREEVLVCVRVGRWGFSGGVGARRGVAEEAVGERPWCAADQCVEVCFERGYQGGGRGGGVGRLGRGGGDEVEPADGMLDVLGGMKCLTAGLEGLTRCTSSCEMFFRALRLRA